MSSNWFFQHCGREMHLIFSLLAGQELRQFLYCNINFLPKQSERENSNEDSCVITNNQFPSFPNKQWISMLKPFFTDLLNRIKEDNLSKGIDNWSGAARSVLVLHSMARANLNKSVWLMTNTTAASKYIPNLHQLKSPLSDPNLPSKSTSKCECCEVRFTS